MQRALRSGWWNEMVNASLIEHCGACPRAALRGGHEEISCRLGRLGCRGVSAGHDVNEMLRERVTAYRRRQRFDRPGPRRAINRRYEELLPALLMDVDSIEGKLSRRDECDSDETDEMTIANIFWGHGGLVTGREKCFPGVVPL